MFSRLFRSMLLWVLVAVVGIMPIAGASAQTTPASRTVTITEAQINQSYRVTNPVQRGVSDVSVNLQPGQVVIASTHTIRTRGANQTYVCSSVWTPGITNGVLTWTLGSATCNGTPATPQLIEQVNTHIGASWRTYWRTQRGGRVQSVTLTENDVTIAYAAR